MKNDYWKKMVKVAREVPAGQPAVMPWGFDTRVIALWGVSTAPEDWSALRSLLRTALATAFLLAMLSLIFAPPNYHGADLGDSSAAISLFQLSLTP
jgi:hypothetical protein